jgi:Delta7-sterol 5-desaturase
MPATFLPLTWALYPAPDAGLADALRLYLAVLLGLTAIYFGLGGLLHWINAHHPERRIQSRPGRHQIYWEIRNSVVALLSISAYVAGGLFAQAKGWTMKPLEPTLLTWIVFGCLSLVLYDTWFYWGHRMMHSQWLYRFHSQHHKSIVPTPWANNSDHPVGAFVEQFYFFVIPFVLPIPPEILIAHKIFDQVTGQAGHAGHEYFANPTTRWPWPLLCTTYHDQHHGFFRYNYANTFSWWDRWMGTIHPAYDETAKRFEELASGSTPAPGTAKRDS